MHFSQDHCVPKKQLIYIRLSLTWDFTVSREDVKTQRWADQHLDPSPEQSKQ